MPNVRNTFLAAGLSACLAAQASAGDGLTLEFESMATSFIAQMDGTRTGFTRFQSVDAVSMEGADGSARLVVELSFPPAARTGDTPHAARISYRPDGWRDYWVSLPDKPKGAITIEHLDLSGPAPRIRGAFAVILCFTKSPVHSADLTRCHPATGAFDTALVPD